MKLINEIGFYSKLTNASELTARRGVDGILAGYGDTYTVLDLRKRARKEPGQIASNKNLQFYLTKKAPANYVGPLTKKEIEGVQISKTIFVDSKGKQYAMCSARTVHYEKYWDTYDSNTLFINDGEFIFNNHFTFRYKYYIDTDNDNYLSIHYKIKTKNWVNYQMDNSVFSSGSSYTWYIPLLEYYQPLLVELDKIIANNKKNSYNYKVAIVVRENVVELLEKMGFSGLGKPTIKFEFENNDELKNFLKENKENLIESFIDVTPEGEEIHNRAALRGAQLPADYFNVEESELYCNGMKPTYKQLSDYSGLIDNANGAKVLRGYGFDKTTLNLLNSCVLNNWRQVRRLAQHLKGDTPKQSAFNLWHFMHTQIKYNYDTAGVEEIRTPARTWADRKNGVDCDCLSVFAYSVLLGMGYNPKFEIVAFKDSDKFSHIYVNLDGLAIDRVLPSFGQRPLCITKKLIMEVPVYELSGCSKSELAGLRGVFENSLRKIQNNTATQADRLTNAKTKLLISLGASDPIGYKLAKMLMPYVVGIDKKGAFYFNNAEIANIAKNGEASILDAERRGASIDELNGILGSFGSWIKKVGKAIAKTVTAPVEATVAATKAAVNVTKAGVQVVSGNKEAAKESFNKAVSNVKESTVDSVVNTAKATASLVKETIINPTVATVKIAGKVFKVILIRINPVTVLIRNALRALIAINFLGMASRLNIANMTQAEAIAAGYDVDKYNSATKAYKRVVNFFTKMGGNKSNIEKTIKNGSKRKALFKTDYNDNTKVTISDDDASLGEAATIASCLAAVGAFFAKVWGWVKSVIPVAKKVVDTAKTAKDVVDTAKDAIDTVKDAVKSNDDKTAKSDVISSSATMTTSKTTSSTGPNLLIIAALFGGSLLLFNNKKHK